jgi:hypothetical protein
MKPIILILTLLLAFPVFAQDGDQTDSNEVTDTPIELSVDSVDVGELDAEVYKLKRDFKAYQNKVDLKLNLVSACFKKASNQYFAGIGTVVVSSLFYYVGASRDAHAIINNTKASGAFWYVLGGAMSFSGFILTISAWSQFHKASEYLVKK